MPWANRNGASANASARLRRLAIAKARQQPERDSSSCAPKARIRYRLVQHVVCDTNEGARRRYGKGTLVVRFARNSAERLVYFAKSHRTSSCPDPGLGRATCLRLTILGEPNRCILRAFGKVVMARLVSTAEIADLIY
jgi:hypothetical protein